MATSIRWQQRFQNFGKAVTYLKNSLAIPVPDDTDRAGIIQFFEMSFELGWKTMKDFLDYKGYTLKAPRDVIKQAFELQYISDGHLWLLALEDRNLMSHTYDEEIAKEVEKQIRTKYFGMLIELEIFFQNQRGI